MKSYSAPKKKDTLATRIKMLLMASSLAITLGGWGLLAAGQIQQNNAVAQTSYVEPAASSSAQSNASQSVSSVSTTSRAKARTRSSR